MSQWTSDEKHGWKSALHGCSDIMEEYRIAGEKEDKAVFTKGHCNLMWNPADLEGESDNPAADREFFKITTGLDDIHTHVPEGPVPTIFSAGYLSSWQPLFLIRHPALAFPSLCRGVVDMQDTNDLYPSREIMTKRLKMHMSFTFTRQLYDWYVAHYQECEKHGKSAAYPIVVDSDDMINNTTVMHALARRLGLDESKVQTTWGPLANADQLNEVQKRFLRTMINSKGIEKHLPQVPLKKNGGFDDTKWVEEFGDELAGLSLRSVEDGMADYEYLMARRFQDN